MKNPILQLIFVLLTFCAPQVQAQISPLAIVTPSVTPEFGQIESSSPELMSPRHALETFLKQMENHASGDASAIDLAIKCLDLADIPEFTRREQGIGLANKLHSILSKTKIEFWKVPNKDIGSAFVLRSDQQGPIVLEKLGSNWQFSKMTIRNIPELFFRLKDEKVLRETTLADSTLLSRLSIRQYIPNFLSQRIFTIEYWQILGIILGLLVAYLVKALFFSLLKSTTSYLTSKSGAHPTAHSIRSFVRPLAYLVAAFTYHFCLYLLDLDPVIYTGLLRVLEIVKIITLFVFLVKSVDLVAEILKIRPLKIFGPSTLILVPLIRSVAKFVMFFVGIVLIANLFSFNLTGLLAGLGIGGLALALAAKDTIENLFGSLTVLVDKPFKVGDFISIEGVSGIVENIGLRSTRLRTPENSLLTVPNSKLISMIVDNLGARKFFRTRISIGITYETPLEKLEQFCESMRELLRNHSSVRADFSVHFNEFASSSLNILIQAYFLASSPAAHLVKQEEFFLNIMRLAKHLGIEFAYPVQRQVEANSTHKEIVEEPVNKESLSDLIQKLSLPNKIGG